VSQVLCEVVYYIHIYIHIYIYIYMYICTYICINKGGGKVAEVLCAVITEVR
jgi:hypothetical protein